MPDTPPDDDGPFTWKQAFICLLISLLVSGFGLLAAIICWSNLYHNLDSRYNWVETPCLVQQAAAGEYGRRSWEITVDYQYTVDGKTYSGQRYSWWEGNLSSQEAHERVRLLRNVPAQHCYVDPENPQESVFDVGILWSGVLIGVPVSTVFSLLGLTLLGATLYGMVGLLTGHTDPKESPGAGA